MAWCGSPCGCGVVGCSQFPTEKKDRGGEWNGTMEGKEVKGMREKAEEQEEFRLRVQCQQAQSTLSALSSLHFDSLSLSLSH